MGCKDIIEEAKMLYKNKCNLNECKIRIAFIHKFGCRLKSSDIKPFNSKVVFFHFDDFRIAGQIFSKGVFFSFYSKDNFWNSEIENLEDLGECIILNEK